KFGSDCLIARRLVERGVRFVQVFTGSAGADDWDAAHADNDKTHREMARRTDRPIAGLLKDLKARGLLDETLVIWGGEFGRTPVATASSPTGCWCDGRHTSPQRQRGILFSLAGAAGSCGPDTSPTRQRGILFLPRGRFGLVWAGHKPDAPAREGCIPRWRDGL